MGKRHVSYFAFSTSPVSGKPAAIPPSLIDISTLNALRDAEKVADAVKHAWSSGVEYVDCSSDSQNEKQIGNALSGFDRSSFYVGSKLSCCDAAPEDVTEACKRSIAELGVSYLDNYMMHWPVQLKSDSKPVSLDDGDTYELLQDGDMDCIMATYEAMERLVDQGLVRSLGVSNMGIRTLSELLSRCRIRPTVLEVEMHPYLAQPKLLEFCREENIHVMANSPPGKMRDGYPDDSSLLDDPILLRIAEESGRSAAQVLLRWGIQRGRSITRKTLSQSLIDENKDVLDWCLSRDHMSRLDALGKGSRLTSVLPSMCDLDRDSENSAGAGHPVSQPHRTPCTMDKNGGLRNRFERPGKYLKTDILVQRGALSDLARLGKSIIPEESHGSANYLITDSVVDALYGDIVLNGLKSAGLDMTKIVVPAVSMDESGEPSTEPNKNGAIFNACVDRVLGNGISKHSCIISLGGGVINNLCGVIAATLYRGIKLVHFTTTSMGMLDAAIDFKQAFNHPCGKNLVGAYYPADLIVMDPECLKTLSNRHMLNGVAEALKHGLTQSWELTSAIVEPLRGDSARLGDSEYLETLCKETIEIKVPTLTHYKESDFNEMVPQYGHAVAHAVEHLSWEEGQVPLLHGEAVAIGMCVTAELGHLLGLCDKSVVDHHYDLVGITGLPCNVPDTMKINDILHAMTYDKHFIGNPCMGFCKEIGVMAKNKDGSYAFSVEMEPVREALQLNMSK
jgi:3-dehydroquinate synthase